MRLKLNYLIILILALFLNGCWNLHVTATIGRSGNVKIDVLYFSQTPIMANDIKNNLWKLGFQNVTAWTSGNTYYIKGSMWRSIESQNLSVGNIFNIKMKSQTRDGLLNVDYGFDTFIGSYDSKVVNDKLFSSIMSAYHIKYTFIAPGRIINTNGMRISSNTVTYYYTLYQLSLGRRRMYVYGTVTKMPPSLNPFDSIENKLVYEKEKLFELQSKLQEAKEVLAKEIDLDTNYRQYINQVNLEIEAMANQILKLFVRINGRNPDSIYELDSFSEAVGMGPLPQPLADFRLVYERGTVKVNEI